MPIQFSNLIPRINKKLVASNLPTVSEAQLDVILNEFNDAVMDGLKVRMTDTRILQAVQNGDSHAD